MSRLYLHDHCPLCVRTRMVAHYRQVDDLEPVMLAYDDEVTCQRLAGGKVLPIFEHQGIAIVESMAIARLLDDLGAGVRRLRPLQLSEAILPQLQSVEASTRALTFARVTRIGLPEFATESARDYFRVKKEVLLGHSFEQALADTAPHQAAVEAVLAQLPALTLPSEQDDTLSWNDVMNFPPLRSLTLVDGLTLPPRLRQWLEEVAALAGVELYFDRAI
ncbi:glutaredoxin 2 [Marinobacterium weihaiense]|uniref:Glutaredoxin 2 n=1 Tax=Marinobacterium weihaiense TaxID=2851016 RepID=A0ABS6MDR1_9GAMM|nr:glutaredoxin 2 [Marinobacterium weihaiense]MBV0934290.1 glutaredoxin 2 [Marinobacterium weihaiense]